MPGEETTEVRQNRAFARIGSGLPWADKRQLLAGEQPGTWNRSSDWLGPHLRLHRLSKDDASPRQLRSSRPSFLTGGRQPLLLQVGAVTLFQVFGTFDGQKQA
jgi:hypothetical protein